MASEIVSNDLVISSDPFSGLEPSGNNANRDSSCAFGAGSMCLVRIGAIYANLTVPLADLFKELRSNFARPAGS
jgi:hypothetical protein